MCNKFNFVFLLVFIFISCARQVNDDVRVEVVKPTIPVLTKKAQSSTIRLNLIRTNKEPYTIENIKISLSGTTDISDIVSECHRSRYT